MSKSHLWVRVEPKNAKPSEALSRGGDRVSGIFGLEAMVGFRV